MTIDFSEEYLSLGDLLEICTEAIKSGCSMDSNVSFSLEGKRKTMIESGEFESAKIDKNWNDDDDPEDMKREYREVVYDYNGLMDFLCDDSSLRTETKHNCLNIIFKNVFV